MRSPTATPELCFPENDAEARGIEAFLGSEGVACTLLPYGDTAYPGIVDRDRPWGVILVPEDQLARAQELLSLWTSAEREDLETAYRQSGHHFIHAPAPRRDYQRALLILAACVMFVAAMLFFARKNHAPLRQHTPGNALPSLG